MSTEIPHTDMTSEAVAKAREAFEMSPEERWRRELNSKDPDREAGAALALGRLAAAEGALEEAVRLLGQAAGTEVPTVTPRALVHLAPVLEKQGRHADADQALRDAQASSDPEHTPDVILDVSAILVSRGQNDQAIRILETVVAWSRNQQAVDDGAGLSRAIAALRLGNLLAVRNGAANAIPYWELAMGANFPAVTPEAAMRLADAGAAGNQGDERRPAKIEELYRIAIDFDDPTVSPDAALKLAEFYLREEQPQLAATEYRSLLPIGGEIAERAGAGLEKAQRGIESERGKTMKLLLAQARSRGRAFQKTTKGKPRKRAVIVGAGTGGTYLLQDLDHRRWEVAGWVDDKQKEGTLIADLPVLGTIDDLPQIIASRKVKAVLIAIPTMSGARRREAVEAALTAEPDVEVLNLPSMFELLRSQNIARQLRKVRIEETMGKQPMSIDREAGAVVRSRSVMITGAGSAIGSELCRQVTHARARYLSLVDTSTTALRRLLGDLDRVRDFGHAFTVLASCDHVKTMQWSLEAHRPEVVFHAAGHNHASIVEDNPLEAMRTDVLGTWDFARLCGEAKVKKFVLVSCEDATESRCGVFNASKALAERSLAAAAEQYEDTDFITVRVGNLFRSPGSVVEVFEHQLETGGPLTLTSADATRRFMRVEMATQLLLRTAQMEKSGGVYTLSSEEEVAIRDLAEWMIRLQDEEVDDVGVEVTRPRRDEGATGNPYRGLERPVSTDIPEVLEIEQPSLAVAEIESALESIRKPIEEGDSAELLALLGGPIRALLDAKSMDVERSSEIELAGG